MSESMTESTPVPTRTIVHLVRHGEVFNPQRILYGRLPDYHLSSRGQSMAAATAEFFEGRDVTYLCLLYTSDAADDSPPV